MNKILKKLFILLLLIYPTVGFSYTKVESVFNNLDTDGLVNKTTVTNHICSKNKEEYIDNSELNDIINLNGNETFTKDGNTLKWKATGKDIYYSGTSNKELPIDIKINYYLNGENKKVKDIVGKKGNIKIEISLENKLKNEVYINGKKEEIYIPFIVMAGTIIDTKDNNNISVTNGRVVETGNKSMIASIASPGLYESLDIKDLNNLNKIEITFDTTNFKLNNIYILATPKLISKEDTKVFDDVDNLVNSINLLQENMNKIQDGSNKLNEGIKSAYNGSNLINEKVNESINSLKESDESVLDNETLESIRNTAINKVTLSDEDLNKIGLLASKEATLSENELNYIATTALNKIGTINLSDEDKVEIANNINNLIDNSYSDVIKSSARNQIDNLINAISSNLAISKEQIIYLSNNQVSEEVAETISNNLNMALLNKLNSSKETLYLISENNAINSSKELAVKVAIASSIESSNKTIQTLVPIVSKETASSISPVVASKTATKVADTVSKEVAGKVSVSVADQVSIKVKNEATKQIKNNMVTLNNGLLELNEGLKQLNEGSNELNSGINRFNSEGINKLNNYSFKVKKYKNKFEALVDLSNDYNGFASNNASETIFINKVKSIK